MSVKTILSEQFKEMITDETLDMIEEAFNQAVEDKSKEKIELEKENTRLKLDEQYTEKLQLVIEKIDEDHTAKLQKLVEAIDTDHAVKLQKLIKSIDAKHTAMLKQVVEKYQRELNEEATTFQNRIVEEISNYLDLYLEKTVPTQQISEAVENIKANRILQQVRQLVGIDEEFISSEVKEALVDGKNTIDSLRAELNSVLKENVELSAKTNKAQAFVLLEQKTSDMPSAKKAYINKLLKNKSPQYIEENFSYVVDMFEKDSQREVESAKEEAQNDFARKPRVDRPQINEEVQNFNNEIERTPLSEGVSGYLNEMIKISNNKYTR